MANLVGRTFAGGGSGGQLTIARGVFTAGNITAPSTSSAWQLVSGVFVDVPAVPGDYIDLKYRVMTNPAVSMFLDLVLAVDDAIVWAASSRTATPLGDGLSSLYPAPGTYRASTEDPELVVGAEHLDDGFARWQVAVKANGAGTLYRSSDHPLRLTGRNHGPIAVEV